MPGLSWERGRERENEAAGAGEPAWPESSRLSGRGSWGLHSRVPGSWPGGAVWTCRSLPHLRLCPAAQEAPAFPGPL